MRVHGKRASESVDEREESEEKEKRMVWREHALVMDTQCELDELNSDVLVVRKLEKNIPRCLRNEYVSYP